jgi:membrane protease YdiL (CAAX protease family)
VTINSQLDRAEQTFGVRAAGLTLLVVLVVLILSDFFLQKLLHQLQGTVGLLSLAHKSQNQMAALRSAVLGLLNPAAIFITLVLAWKIHFPGESLKARFARFGCIGAPSIKIVLSSFGLGVLYVVIFIALARLFPSGFSAIPNPANVINYGSTAEKALFALTAVTIVPISEELLFRGVLYQGIANSWGKPISAVCVSAVFIMLHPENIASGYWLTHAALYISPLFFLGLREIGGTLYSSMAAHSGFNFMEIFF